MHLLIEITRTGPAKSLRIRVLRTHSELLVVISAHQRDDGMVQFQITSESIDDDYQSRIEKSLRIRALAPLRKNPKVLVVIVAHQRDVS